jgi:hypothetical protein
MLDIVFVERGLSERLRRIDGKRGCAETLGRNDESHQQSFHLIEALSQFKAV